MTVAFPPDAGCPTGSRVTKHRRTTGELLPVSRGSTGVSDSSAPPQAVADHWDELLGDADATAAEYRETGRDPLVVHTAEVGVLTGDPFGLDAVAPDDEFAALRALADGAAFDESHVYGTVADGVRFLLVVVEAASTDEVVVVPVYLPVADAGPLRERAGEAGRMYTHVRTVAGENRVSFRHDDPAPFF